MRASEILERLKGFEILESEIKRESLGFVSVQKEALFGVLSHLKTVCGLLSLDVIACTDFIEDGKFCITYILEDGERSVSFGVKIYIARENEGLQSVIPLWRQAEIFERELHEMFGIDIAGHPSLGDFMLEDWRFTPPMRREFDTLAFVNEQYSTREGREDNLDVKEEMKKRREAKKAQSDEGGDIQ